MNRQKQNKRGQAGLSLVELLVALVIGLVLLAGVYQVFTGSSTTYNENEQFARLQENARFALVVLGRELRGAGYSGCSGDAPVNNINPAGTGYNNAFLDFSKAINGYDWNGAGWTPTLDPVITNALNGSDVFAVRGLENQDEVEITGSNTNAANLAVVSRSDIKQSEIVIVSDCKGGDIFQVTNNNTSTTLAHGVSTNPGNIGTTLSKGYNSGADVFKFRSLIFYLRNNPAVPPVPSLYRLRWDGSSGASGAVVSEELVPGVENMQVRYGLDTTGDRQVDSYVSAGAVGTNWNQVIAVRIALLMQSAILGKVPVDTATYDMDGDGSSTGTNDFDPPDERRLRRVFKGTFTLRNRIQ